MSQFLNYPAFLPIACLLKFENIPLVQLAFSYSKLLLVLFVAVFLLDC